jgi:sugar phosphate isomerase/epimerase
MKLAVQLYTVRDILGGDFKGVMTQISKLGYAGVEFAGFYGIPADEMKQLLRELHLEAVSSHTSLELLENHFDEITSYNKAIGNNNIVIPWTEMRTYEQYLSILVRLKKVCKKLAEMGFSVHYHNHAHEFATHEGKYLLDCLFTEMKCLGVELDVHWAARAGVSPVDYIIQYATRIKLLHMKDLIRQGDEVDYAPVGTGELDFKGILKAASTHTEWLIVENDAPRNGSMEDITISIRNLKKLLKL